ncbi:unnamed protein product, partial [Closterium sp. NIES-54]
VAVSGQVLVYGPVAASCSCRSLAHPTVLWHYRMGHPSISCMHAMYSQRLVLGLPPVLPSLPPSLAPPCGPCVEEFVVVDDFSRYTTLFPLAKKSDLTSTLIRWLLTTADTRGRRISCLHSDRGGEFCFGILAGFCRKQGIHQSWTLPKSPKQNGVAEHRIGLVMEIARTSMTHARAPHFLRPYAVRYAAHQLNLWPRVSRPEVSSTSLWTGSPGAASRFRVWGYLALVRDTSADKISPHAVSCMFLCFPGDSSDYTFYHPPLHRLFDSRDVRFDESIPYYVRYPCRGLPVPPPPLFLTSAPPPAPPVQPPPPGPAPSGVSHATPPPLVAPQVQPPSPQSSSQPTADPAGASFCGEDPRGASSRGAGVGAKSVPVRAGVSGAVPGGATPGGAPFAGPGEPGTDPVTSGGAGSGGGATGSLESGPGATTALDTTPPSHPYPTRHQACVCRAREEKLELEREERVGAAAAGATAAGGAVAAAAAGAGVATAAAAATSSSCLCQPRSSPSVLPSPPESALTASLSSPVTDYYRTYRPVLSRVLASLVTDPCAFLSSVSALTATVTEFASTRCLDYATSLVAAPPTSPLAVGGESSLGCDALEDRQFELEFLAAASPHLCAMLLALEGDP